MKRKRKWAKSRKNMKRRQFNKMKRYIKEGWEEALYDMFNPNIPDPIISFNENYLEAFYIDVNDWTVHLNMAHAPVNWRDPKEIQMFARAISQHELGHYTIAPYDGVTNARMFQEASKIITAEHAAIACNVVTDLIVEHHLSTRFKELSEWCFSRLAEQVFKDNNKNGQLSKTWKLMVLAETMVTGKEVPKIINEKVDFTDVKSDSRKIARTINNCLNDMNAWPKAAKKVAAIIKPYIYSEFPTIKQKNSPDPSSNLRNVPGEEDSTIRVPSDVLEQYGDVTKVSDKDTGRMNEKSLKKGKEASGKGIGDLKQDLENDDEQPLEGGAAWDQEGNDEKI
ncbi:MAG: hypothetical protein ACTSXP_11870, partial [Promethearchaeota archaeon]